MQAHYIIATAKLFINSQEWKLEEYIFDSVKLECIAEMPSLYNN